MRARNERLEELREFIAAATAPELHVIRTVDIPHFVGISDHERADLFKRCNARCEQLLKRK